MQEAFNINDSFDLSVTSADSLSSDKGTVPVQVQRSHDLASIKVFHVCRIYQSRKQNFTRSTLSPSSGFKPETVCSPETSVRSF
jgi:hypothetical protein